MKLKSIFTAVFFVLAPIAFGQSQTTTPSYDALEELAGRLIGYGYSEPELMVGKLPTDRLKLELPTPTGARVLGTSVGEENFEVVMDIKDTSDNILDFYRQQFKDWQDKGSTQGGPKGGFKFSSSETTQSEYVADTLLCGDEWSMSVIVYRLDAAIKDVRLRIDKYTCEFSSQGVALPNLYMPENSEPRSGSNGFGGDIFSSLTLNTNLSMELLFQHYNQQLEKAGWLVSEKVMLKNGVLVTYEFQAKDGQKWGAIMTILPAKDGLLNASLRAYPL